MIIKALSICTIPRTAKEQNVADATAVTQDRRQKLSAGRRVLKQKILTYFVLGLFFNILNAVVYTLASFVLAELFYELTLITGCLVVLYNLSNLLLLDMLRDEVLKKKPPPDVPLRMNVVSSVYNLCPVPALQVREIENDDGESDPFAIVPCPIIVIGP